MPIDVFISYASEDRTHREQLEKHLAGLLSAGIVRTWDRERIAPGEERLPALYRQIDAAQIALLLVSSDFLASDYCCRVELGRIRERWARGELHVVPIILRSCNWIGALQGFDGLKKHRTHCRAACGRGVRIDGGDEGPVRWASVQGGGYRGLGLPGRPVSAVIARERLNRLDERCAPMGGLLPTEGRPGSRTAPWATRPGLSVGE